MSLKKISIDQVDVNGCRVLMRVDFNVPQDDTGQITDDMRIRMAIPTIKSVLTRGGKIILMSHLGRPSGAGYEAKFTLKPVADALSDLLDTTVQFPSQDCLDEAASSTIAQMKNSEILLLENLRFHAGETKGDPAFAAKLAEYGEIFCNDAFGTCHRAHASMVGVPQAMGDAPCVAGLLVKKEIDYLSSALARPQRPFTAILGGAKVSDKLGAIRNLVNSVDTILIGGAMAYTFLHVLGRRVGKSLVESDRIKDAKEIIQLAAESSADLFFPNDHVCGREISEQTPIQVSADHIEDGWMGLDIGPKSQELFCRKIRESKTIVWNGPVGVFEIGPFAVGSEGVAKAIADATKKGAVSILGGGDTAAAAEQFGLTDRYSHISTGGGASLQMLEGKPLPGVDVLTDG